MIVRQRPATAKGFLFITLEDETGLSNLIVTPALFQRHRLLLRRANLLLAEGVLQQVEGVRAIRVWVIRQQGWTMAVSLAQLAGSRLPPQPPKPPATDIIG